MTLRTPLVMLPACYNHGKVLRIKVRIHGYDIAG